MDMDMGSPLFTEEEILAAIVKAQSMDCLITPDIWLADIVCFRLASMGIMYQTATSLGSVVVWVSKDAFDIEDSDSGN
jgi:hypothetical protein